eukprot:CCRYP_002647-RB/>CCRYP_002647-RB protein AED:0.04 eAED:0.04 QI:80/1/1/1/0/0/2/576/192
MSSLLIMLSGVFWRRKWWNQFDSFAEVYCISPQRKHTKTTSIMATERNRRPALSPISTSLSRWSSDVITQFINFSFIGAAWGCFNPIPVAGSKEALAIARSGKFVPLRPFSSLASVGYCGATVGSVVFVSRFVSGGMTLVRDKDDWLNEIIGLGAAAAYCKEVLFFEDRCRWNNRFVAGSLVGAILYANVAP